MPGNSRSLLTRRELLSRVATLMATSPFVLWCERARSMTPFAFWKKRSASGGGSGTYPADTGDDPYWDYVVLLMNMDTPTPSTGFTSVFADESNVGKTVTVTGSPYIDNSKSPYSGGVGSSSFGGSSGLTLPDSSDFQFGTGDYTIEAWIYPTSTSSGVIIAQGGQGSSLESFRLHLDSGSLKTYASSSNSSYDIMNNVAIGSISANQWTHVALVRSGSSFFGFINGTKTTIATSSSSLNNNGCLVGIAGSTSTSALTASFNGNISDLRAYKGIAKYTANFTPRTTPIGLGTANDKYWGYCVLACPFENSLKDMSGKRCAVNGSPALTSGQKKYGTASLSLNGSSSYLSIPAGSVEELGSSDFTIEAWIYLNSTSTFDIWNTGFDSSNYHLFRVTSSQNLYFSERFSHPVLTGATTLSTSQWYHVAISRKGSNYTLFVNGVVDATATDSSALPSVNAARLIGAWTDASLYANGYIDSLRITKGFARYTSNFTPPTASFPVGKNETIDPFWSYTVLAMHMDDLTDATGRHVITTNGTPTFDTTVKKFGANSAQFAGSGNYLTSAYSNDFRFGSEDFTVETWFNPTSFPSTSTLVAFYDTANNRCWWIRLPSSTIVDFRYSVDGLTASSITGSAPLAANNWHHVAVARANGTIQIFLNGVRISTASVGTLFASAATLRIGDEPSQSSVNFLGCIDDLRITKGVARYVNNFTPPTRAFATSPVSSYSDYDPFYSSTVLLMPMDNFTDVTGHTVSNAGGGVTTSSSIYKFGTGSSYMNASNQYFYLDQSTDFDFGSAAFTIEMWINGTTWGSNVTLAAKSNYNASTYSFQLGITSAGKLYLNASSNGTSWNLVNASAGTTTISLNTWHHVSATRDGNNIYLFVDGTLDATISVGSTALATISGNVDIGSMRGVDQFKGYIDDVRITKGAARYTASFAPPSRALATSAGIVTSGLVALLDAGDAASYDGSSQTWKNIVTSPADGPVLLLHMDGSNGGTTFTDATSRHTATASGTVTTSTTQSKFGGSSAFFNQSSQGRLILSSSDDYAFGTGDFTIEFWFYPNSFSGYQGYFSVEGGGISNWYRINCDADGTFNFFATGVNNILSISSSQISTGAWHHIAVTRAAGTARLFVDGTLKASAAFTNNISGSGTAALGIYRVNESTYTFDGYMDEVRIHKGTALYTNNFTVPSAAFSFPGSTTYDFYRGSGSGSDGADPSFIGVAGGRSANDYFSFDGGDYFTLAGANTSFINSLHQDNAQFTLIVVAHIANNAAWNNWLCSFATDGQYGIAFQLNNSGKLQFSAFNSTSSISRSSDSVVPTGIHMAALSVNEGSTGFFYLDGLYASVSSSNTWSAAYSGPTSNTATHVMKIGADGAAVVPLSNGSRVYSVLIYNRALSKAELDQNFNATRSRFGL